MSYNGYNGLRLPKGYAKLGDLMFEALYKPYLDKKNKS